MNVWSPLSEAALWCVSRMSGGYIEGVLIFFWVSAVCG